jgi:hypothetical protein
MYVDTAGQSKIEYLQSPFDRSFVKAVSFVYLVLLLKVDQIRVKQNLQCGL